MKKSLFLLSSAIILLNSSISAQEAGLPEDIPQLLSIDSTTTMIVGIPYSRVNSGENSTDRKVLSEKDSKEYQLRIAQIDGKFYWNSRENRELFHLQSGSFDIFIDPSGAGFIKATYQNGKKLYVEVLHLGLTTITYWGELELH